jgi:hypothetical protein
LFINYSSISREISAKTWDIENLWFLWKNVFFSEKQKLIIQIRMKSVFEINELHLKFVYKLKGCSSEYVLIEPHPKVIIIWSVLRVNFRCSMKTPGMPIRHEESSRSDLTYNCLRLGWVRSIYSGRFGRVGT